MSYGTTEETANRKGAALAVQLGHNWERRVWENLGWCYCASFKGNTDITVVCNEYPGLPHITTIDYTCFFYSATHFIGHGATPGEALQDAIEKAQRAMNTILEDVMSVQKKGKCIDNAV